MLATVVVAAAAVNFSFQHLLHTHYAG